MLRPFDTSGSAQGTRRVSNHGRRRTKPFTVTRPILAFALRAGCTQRIPALRPPGSFAVQTGSPAGLSPFARASARAVDTPKAYPVLTLRYRRVEGSGRTAETIK